MIDLDVAKRNLVIANRILANEGVVDAYGHVSMRHPHRRDRYLLSRSRSPELVEVGDIIEFELDGTPINDKRPPYLERYIHGAIYASRPDIQGVVHSHADEVLPFGISTTKLRPVVHTAGCLGHRIPVWDIAEKFGDTRLLVTNMEQGRDLAATLGPDRVVLMRGHGFAAAGPSLAEVVRISVYMPRNAQTLMSALRLGEVKSLSAGEIEHHMVSKPDAPEWWRAWEYWAKRAKCEDLLADAASLRPSNYDN